MPLSHDPSETYSSSIVSSLVEPMIPLALGAGIRALSPSIVRGTWEARTGHSIPKTLAFAQLIVPRARYRPTCVFSTSFHGRTAEGPNRLYDNLSPSLSVMGFYQTPIPLTPSKTDLTGQTIIVTGATAGLGYESSLQFLRLKASTVILGVRNDKKGNAAREWLLADSEVRRVNPQAKVKVLQLDLVDFRSIVDFANQVLREEAKLNILLLNAGINLAQFQRSPSGHEM